jgi:hypothetical protein
MTRDPGLPFQLDMKGKPSCERRKKSLSDKKIDENRIAIPEAMERLEATEGLKAMEDDLVTYAKIVRSVRKVVGAMEDGLVKRA